MFYRTRRRIRATGRLIRRTAKAHIKIAQSYFNPRSRMYSLGAQGERAACRYLRKNYYLIWERNYRSRFGEIDIIASQGRTLVFVEVKSRAKLTSEKFSGLDAVDQEKQERILRAAQFFIKEHPSLLRRRRTLGARFDVIVTEKCRRWPWPLKLSQYSGIWELRRARKS